jgi:hypothetical protein
MASAPDDKKAAFEKEAIHYLDTVYRVALRLSGDPSQADGLKLKARGQASPGDLKQRILESLGLTGDSGSA